MTELKNIMTRIIISLSRVRERLERVQANPELNPTSKSPLDSTESDDLLLKIEGLIVTIILTLSF